MADFDDDHASIEFDRGFVDRMDLEDLAAALVANVMQRSFVRWRLNKQHDIERNGGREVDVHD